MGCCGYNYPMNHQGRHQLTWIGRIRRWLGGSLEVQTAAYPDYVTCPRCGELEIEVWNCEEPIRCHACLKEFTCTETQINQARERSH